MGSLFLLSFNNRNENDITIIYAAIVETNLYPTEHYIINYVTPSGEIEVRDITTNYWSKEYDNWNTSIDPRITYMRCYFLKPPKKVMIYLWVIDNNYGFLSLQNSPWGYPPMKLIYEF